MPNLRDGFGANSVIGAGCFAHNPTEMVVNSV